MPQNVELDPGKLNDQITELIRSLKSLEGSIGGVAKQASQVDRLFGDTKGLNSFIRAIKKIDDKGVQNFGKMSNAIKRLYASAADIPDTTKLAAFGDGISSLARAADQFRTLNSAQMRTGVKQMADETRYAFDVFSKLEPGIPDVITRSMQSLSTFSSTLLRLGGNEDKLAEGAQNLRISVKSIGDAFGSINNPNLAPRIQAFAQGVAPSMNALSEAMRAFSAIQRMSSSLLDIDDENNPVKKFLMAIGKIAEVVSEGDFSHIGKETVASLNSIQGVLKAITRLGTQELNIESVRIAFGAIAEFSKDMENRSVEISPEMISFFKTIPDVIRALSEGLSIAVDPEDVKAKYKNVFKTFEFVSKGFAQAATNAQMGYSTESLQRMSSSITSLVGTIPKLVSPELLDKIPKTGMFHRFSKAQRDLNKFFKTTRYIAANLNKVANEVPEGEHKFANLKHLGSSLLNLSKAIPNIMRASQELPRVAGLFRIFSRARRNLNGLFSTIGYIVKQAAKVSSKHVNTEALTGIAKFIHEIKAFSIENDFSDFKHASKNIAAGLKNISQAGKLPNIKLSGMTTPPELSDRYGDQMRQYQQQSSKFLAAQVIKVVTLRYLTLQVYKNIGLLGWQFLDLGRTVERAFDQMAEKIKSTGQSMMNFGRTINRNFGIEKILKSSGFQSALGYDQLLSNLRVFGQLTDEGIERSKELANQIGMDYPLSANAALEATLSLLKAGRTLGEAEFALPIAADIQALAENKTLDDVTKFTINAANGFRMFTSDVRAGFDTLSVAADIMFQASNTSTASIDNLIDGVTKVAPSANAMNLTMQETAALLANIEDAGIRGTEAGRQLATVIDAILKKGGGRNELYEWIQGNQSVIEIGDTVAQRGLRILRNADRDGRGVDETIRKMGEVGSAAEAAAGLLDNMRGDIVQLTGSFETLLTKALVPTIERFFRPFVKLARVVVNGLVSLPAPIIDTAVNTIVLVSAFASLAGGMAIVTGGLMTMTGVLMSTARQILPFLNLLKLLSLPMLALAGTAIIVTGALTYMGAMVTAIYKSVEDNVGGAGDAFIYFKRQLSYTIDEVQRIFKAFSRGFEAAFGGQLLSTFVDIGTRVAGVFSYMGDRLQAFQYRLMDIDNVKIATSLLAIRGWVEMVAGATSNLAEGVYGFLTNNQEAMNAAQRGLGVYARMFSRMIENLTGYNLSEAIFYFDSGQMKEGFRAFVSGIFNGIRHEISSNRDRIADIVKSVMSAINPINKTANLFWLLGFDNISSKLKWLGDQINTFVGGAVKLAIDLLEGKPVIDKVKRETQKITQDLRKAIRSDARDIEETASNLFSAINPLRWLAKIVEFFGFDDLAGNLNRYAENVEKFVSSAINAVGDFLRSDIPGKIVSGAKSVYEFVKNLIVFIVDKAKELYNTVAPIASNIFGTVLNVGARIFEAIKKLVDDVSSGAVSIPGMLLGIANTIVTAIAGVFISGFNFISEKINELSSRIDLTNLASNIVFTVARAIQTGIAAIIPFILSMASSVLLGVSIQNIPILREISAWVGKVIAAFAVLPIKTLGSIVKLFEEMGVSGGTAILALTAGIIASIYWFDVLKAKVISTGMYISTAFSGVGPGIANGIKGAISSLAQLRSEISEAGGFSAYSDAEFEKTKQQFASLWENVKTTGAGIAGTVGEVFGRISASAISIANSAKAYVLQVGTTIKGFATGIATSFASMNASVSKSSSIFDLVRTKMYAGMATAKQYTASLTSIGTSAKAAAISMGKFTVVIGKKAAVGAVAGIAASVKSIALFSQAAATSALKMAGAFLKSPFVVITLAASAFQAIVDNLKYLKEGDIFGFIFNTISSLAINILEMFGLDDNSIAHVRNFLGTIENTIRRVIDNIVIWLDNALADVEDLISKIPGVDARTTARQQRRALRSSLENASNNDTHAELLFRELANRAMLEAGLDERSMQAHRDTILTKATELSDDFLRSNVDSVAHILRSAGISDEFIQSLDGEIRDIYYRAFGGALTLGEDLVREYTSTVVAGMVASAQSLEEVELAAREIIETFERGFLDKDARDKALAELFDSLEEDVVRGLDDVIERVSRRNVGLEAASKSVIDEHIAKARRGDSDADIELLIAVAAHEAEDGTNEFRGSVVELISEMETANQISSEMAMMYRLIASGATHASDGMSSFTERARETSDVVISEAQRQTSEAISQLVDELTTLPEQMLAERLPELLRELGQAGIDEYQNIAFYEIVREHLNALERENKILAGTSSSFDRYVSARRQASTSLEYLAEDQAVYNRRLEELLVLMNAVDDRGQIKITPPELTGMITDEFSDEGDELDNQLEGMADKIEKFEIEQSRRARDNQEKEQERAHSITKMISEYHQQVQEKIDKHHLQVERDREDHHRRLREIDNTANENIRDAIRSRNAAAALSAIRERRKSIQDEKSDYALAQQRREEDFRNEQIMAQQRHEERVKEAERELALMKFNNRRALQERLADFERENNIRRQASGRWVQVNQDGVNNMVDAAEKAYDHQQRLIEIAIEMAGNAAQRLFERFRTEANRTSGWLDGARTLIRNTQNSTTATPTTMTPRGGFSPVSGIPTMATGGRILSDGLVYAHKGEMISNPAIRPAAVSRGNVMPGVNLSIDLGGVHITGAPHMEPEEIISMAEERIVGGIVRVIERRIQP